MVVGVLPTIGVVLGFNGLLALRRRLMLECLFDNRGLLSQRRCLILFDFLSTRTKDALGRITLGDGKVLHPVCDSKMGKRLYQIELLENKWALRAGELRERSDAVAAARGLGDGSLVVGRLLAKGEDGREGDVCSGLAWEDSGLCCACENGDGIPGLSSGSPFPFLCQAAGRERSW